MKKRNVRDRESEKKASRRDVIDRARARPRPRLPVSVARLIREVRDTGI